MIDCKHCATDVTISSPGRHDRTIWQNQMIYTHTDYLVLWQSFSGWRMNTTVWLMMKEKNKPSCVLQKLTTETRSKRREGYCVQEKPKTVAAQTTQMDRERDVWDFFFYPFLHWPGLGNGWDVARSHQHWPEGGDTLTHIGLHRVTPYR